MSETKPDMRTAFGIVALQQLATPTVELMAKAKSEEDRERYFRTYVKACGYVFSGVPEIQAHFDADEVARSLLGGKGRFGDGGSGG